MRDHWGSHRQAIDRQRALRFVGYSGVLTQPRPGADAREGLLSAHAVDRISAAARRSSHLAQCRMDAFPLDPNRVRDISSLLLERDGTFRVLPASAYEGTTQEERLLFGVRHGVYGFPTTELVEFIRERIAGRRAIEIGSGNGALAAALGIPATDNRQQEDPAIRAYYDSIGQPVVRYGGNVEKLSADDAIEKYKPDVVVASWVTHRFDPMRQDAGGSETGVDEVAVLKACEMYLFVGNEQVHAKKAIWTMPHSKFTPSWVFSRAMNGSPDFVAIWSRT